MTDAFDAMVSAAERLRAVVLDKSPDITFNVGATQAELDRLVADFAPLHVPEELLALLTVFNGTSYDDVLLFDTGALLTCEEITEHTEMHRRVAQEENEGDWCPAWMVFTAMDWRHAAVLASQRSRPRSPVIALDYPDFVHPVRSANLTSLVVASCSAWEQGLHELQIASDTPEGFAAERQARGVRERLLAESEPRFLDDDGLAGGDAVTGWADGWPLSWPRGKRFPLTQPGPPVSLAEGIGHDQQAKVIRAQVGEIDGDRFLVTGDGSSVWVRIPPAFRAGREFAPGQQIFFCMSNPSVAVVGGYDRDAWRLTALFDVPSAADE